MRLIGISVLAVAASLSLVACEENTRTARREAEKIDRQAGKLEEKAGALRSGVTYEVARVDSPAMTVKLTRKGLGKPGTEPDGTGVEMQSGSEHPGDLSVTFADLEKFVEGDKKGAEIAAELSTGENVTVFFDADHKITKITY